MVTAIEMKYELPFSEPKTENEILEAFDEIKNTYNNAKKNNNFIFKTKQGKNIVSVKQLLTHITKRQSEVYVIGSGNFEGLNVDNATINYNANSLGEAVQFWDLYRDGTCSFCMKNFEDSLIKKNGYTRCNNKLKSSGNGCEEYKSILKNNEGNTARNLNDLIFEASQNK